MTAHASQISETSFFLAMPPDVFSTVWGREWYIRVLPSWDMPQGSPWETGLLLEAPEAVNADVTGAGASGGGKRG